jgi:hypothetical protein
LTEGGAPVKFALQLSNNITSYTTIIINYIVKIHNIRRNQLNVSLEKTGLFGLSASMADPKYYPVTETQKEVKYSESSLKKINVENLRFIKVFFKKIYDTLNAMEQNVNEASIDETIVGEINEKLQKVINVLVNSKYKYEYVKGTGLTYEDNNNSDDDVMNVSRKLCEMNFTPKPYEPQFIVPRIYEALSEEKKQEYNDRQAKRKIDYEKNDKNYIEKIKGLGRCTNVLDTHTKVYNQVDLLDDGKMTTPSMLKKTSEVKKSVEAVEASVEEKPPAYTPRKTNRRINENYDNVLEDEEDPNIY